MNCDNVSWRPDRCSSCSLIALSMWYTSLRKKKGTEKEHCLVQTSWYHYRLLAVIVLSKTNMHETPSLSLVLTKHSKEDLCRN